MKKFLGFLAFITIWMLSSYVGKLYLVDHFSVIMLYGVATFVVALIVQHFVEN